MDLDRPPYRPYRELLAELRRGGGLPRVAFREARDGARGVHDANQGTRDRVVCLLSLEARAEDLELVRLLTEQEVAARRADSFQGAGDTLARLSVLLVRLGDASDAARCWRARRANVDTLLGYDARFVVAFEPPRAAIERLRRELPEEERSGLDELDPDELAADLPAWREGLDRWFPRTPEELDDAGAEAVAELFGDRESQALHGERNATTPSDRGYLYRRLERWGEALEAWRAAAAATDDPWSRTSLLVNAMSDAARLGRATVAEAREVDVLRHRIDGFADVGLGRAAVRTCFELAASVDDEAVGRELFGLAEAWRVELSSAALVDLEAGVRAAWRWGTPEQLWALQAARDEERAQVEELLRGPDRDP